MKYTFIFMALFFTSFAHAESYKIDVKKTEKDLYISTDRKFIIETRYCNEGNSYLGTRATLEYDKYDYDNKLIFDNGKECEVKKVATL